MQVVLGVVVLIAIKRIVVALVILIVLIIIFVDQLALEGAVETCGQLLVLRVQEIEPRTLGKGRGRDNAKLV